jgi:hypothetical protein
LLATQRGPRSAVGLAAFRGRSRVSVDQADSKPLRTQERTHLVNTRIRDPSLVVGLILAGFACFFPGIAWLLHA